MGIYRELGYNPFSYSNLKGRIFVPHKIRQQFPINLEKRNDTTKVKINKWLDAQSNYSASVISIIEHMIERFGYVDVTDREISRKLYEEILHVGYKEIQLEKTEINIDSPIRDAKKEINTETPVVENYSETTIRVEDEHQMPLFIKINPENRVLLIRYGAGKELSYKF